MLKILIRMIMLRNSLLLGKFACLIAQYLGATYKVLAKNYKKTRNIVMFFDTGT